MKFIGSKNRIAKYILPIILADKHNYSLYWEPFVGGGNMIDKVDGIYRLGTDIDYDVISALNVIKNHLHLIPKDNLQFKAKDYKQLKGSGSMIEGYVSYALSYGGKKWGGWCRDSAGKRDYVAEAYSNALRQSEKLQKDLSLSCGEYWQFQICDAIIYCDIPYKGTTKYKYQFDYNLFYDWCYLQKDRGNKIFVSEYSMPSYFKCVWEKEIHSSLTKNTGAKQGIEKIFTL